MITKKMKIGEAIKEKSKVAEVLIEQGIFCVGCPAAAMETIEQGLQAHGKSDKEIDEIIKKMNSK